MSNETNSQILKNISREILKGLFPYIFANTNPSAINKKYNYSVSYDNKNDNKINKNNLVASKTRKKIIYKTHSVDWKSISLLNYSSNVNYSEEVCFKNKRKFKLSNNIRRQSSGKFSKISLNNSSLGQKRRFTDYTVTNNNLHLYSKYKEYRSSIRNSRRNLRNNIGENHYNNSYKSRLH